MFRFTCFTLFFLTLFSSSVFAHQFPSLDEALPNFTDITSIAPVFDFDGDGCFPAAGISRDGAENGGLKPSGSLGGSCRPNNFLEYSNTLHRHACKQYAGANYCGHFYALYFEKDQIFSGIESGHRHDWEFAGVWTVDGTVTHASYSYHRDIVTVDESAVPKNPQGQLKFVYHKEGLLTHAIRLAKNNEIAENPYGVFVTPTIASWYELYGDHLDNSDMRALLNLYDYGSANLPIGDAYFLNKLNQSKPSGFPVFSQTDIEASGNQ